MATETLVGVGQAAEELGLSTQAVRDLIRSGKLAGSKDLRGRWLIDAASVSGYVAKHGRRKRAALDAARIERRLEKLGRSVDSLLEANTSAAQLLEAVERERDRYRSDAAATREAALHLVASAQDTHTAVSELLGVLQKQGGALVQLLAPGSPQDLMP
jgi:excisionase family DNA binding protein